LRCPYESARALAESGDPEALRTALATLEQLGARPMVAVVTRRMRELGLPAIPRGPRPTTRSNPAGLTTRQLDVLRLAATGLGNRAIAERLYLSPKTVEHHMSAILVKLDAADRADAVRKAQQLSMLP
jgi:DNA-binding NarL/FixJ family response regulator